MARAVKTWTKLPVPTDIRGALDQLGIDYQVSGDNAKILCPWHEDRKPSCYVHLTSGVAHCFSCGEKGQFNRLVRTILRGSEEQAALWCQTRVTSRQRGTGDDTGPAERVRVVTEADLALYEPVPWTYRRQRGLSLDACNELGILWDRENERWIIPIRDADGKLVGWQEKGQGHHEELIRPREVRKPLFGLAEVRGQTAVLVESPLDVCRLRTVGVRYGVASYGVSVSEHQLGLLAARFDRCIVAFDNDEAGWESSERLRTEFHRIPLWFYNYGTSTAKDPGDQSRAEIVFGIKNATSAMRTRF